MEYYAVKTKFYNVVQKDDDSFWSKAFDLFIISVILFNVGALMLETVSTYHDQYESLFYRIELVSLLIFSIEFLLRIWVITEEEKYRHPLRGRLKYIVSFSAIIDLLAIVPFYLPFITSMDARALRVFRVFRVFRIFGLNRYSSSAELINKVIKSRSSELIFSFVIILKLLLVAATLMYFVEHKAQPDLFSSIPATMWWGIATLTTVGYGDMVPITLLGKVLAGVMAILGIGVFALPAGILANGFSEEMKHRRAKSIDELVKDNPKSSIYRNPNG